MKTKRIKECFCALVFLGALLVFIMIFSTVTIPKRIDFGAMWGSFLKEEENSLDVMFFGSSLVYCDIIPALLYEETGIAGYVLAGPTQNMPTTYYYMNEMFRTQNPETIFLEATGMFFPPKTDFNLVNVGYMPWTLNRLGATFHGADREEWLGLLFPPYVYHDRWHELTPADFKPYGDDPQAGYTYLAEVIKTGEPEERPVEFEQENYDKNMAYLYKIMALCQEKDTDLVLYITPSHWRIDDSYIDMLKDGIQGMPFTDFINFNETFDNIGILPESDFYDLAHFNYQGAEKFTRYLAGIIEQEYPPAEYRGEAALWERRIEHYYSIDKPVL